MKDIRTPTTYFQQRGASPEAEEKLKGKLEELNSLEKLKGKLDELLTALYALKERGKGTPATKKIIETEIDKAEIQRYKQVSKENALKVVEAFIYGTPVDAADAICEALDYKAFCRAEPYMVSAGDEIEEQVFRN